MCWFINSVKFSKCLDFETLLWKSCSLNSESKSQVICGCEKFSLGRTASFSVKILFNRQIFRTTQFRSRRGCCVRLTSACCACFWNNSFRRSCSRKVQTSETRGNRDMYGNCKWAASAACFQPNLAYLSLGPRGSDNGRYLTPARK